MWLKHKEQIVNLENVTFIEREGKLVVFHFLGNSEPLVISFNNEEEACTWFEGFLLTSKIQKKAVDTTHWKLN
ncbi:hypothetical protein GFV12_05270 [Desulfurobacterium thermolithotrophum]|uniref:hypothetical protein n=1 Tax=Desulfurobacterium thermolithotrophum TaxID=64160 RepID=UPI0013D12DFC|nr:hypothetical protein [Desulfurobacterium thermolithotrophum]